MKPGSVEAFEIAIPAGTLTSPKEGLDKNMHKALKVQDYPDITFRLTRFEPQRRRGRHRARPLACCEIAGVEREVAIDITTKRTGATLTVRGRLDLLMTDYGIKPPVGHARHAEDESEGDGYLRDGPGDSAHVGPTAHHQSHTLSSKEDTIMNSTLRFATRA